MFKLAKKGDESLKAGEERMMTSQLLGLIDTCFEDGHYEAGMDVLERGLSPGFYPAPHQVRVLLYLALYPPNSATNLPVNYTSNSLTSPRKERLRKLMAPSSAASERATALLRKLALLDRPSKLTIGLPAYGKKYVQGDGWRVDVLPGAQEDQPDFIPDRGVGGYSKIDRDSEKVAECRDIWQMLEDGFIKQVDSAEGEGEDEIFAFKGLGTDAFSTPKRRSTRRKGKAKAYEPMDEDEDPTAGQNVAKPSVAKHAWPVAEWFVILFEADQRLSGEHNTGHSALLLSQLPIASPRTDIVGPLKVAFAAMTSTPYNQTTFRIGTRLINLLAHLCIPLPPQSLNPAACLRQINASLLEHIADPANGTPDDFLDLLLSNVATDLAFFKISLCCLHLATTSVGADPSKLIGGANRGVARPGGTPMKMKPGRRQQATATSTNAAASTSSVPAPLPSSRPIPFPLPSLDEVLKLIALSPKLGQNEEEPTFFSEPPKPDDRSYLQMRQRLNHAICKLHLLSAILTSGVEESQVAEATAWKAAGIDGRLANAMSSGLPTKDELGRLEAANGDAGQMLLLLARLREVPATAKILLGARA